jgi:cell division protein FtsB
MSIDVTAESRLQKGPAPLRRKRVEPAVSNASGRRKWLNLLLGFVAAVLLVDALVGEEGLMDRLRARDELARATAELEGLKRQNAAMLEEKQRLNEDPTMIEAIAREQLGLIRAGELMFIVKDTKTPHVTR